MSNEYQNWFTSKQLSVIEALAYNAETLYLGTFEQAWDFVWWIEEFNVEPIAIDEFNLWDAEEEGAIVQCGEDYFSVDACFGEVAQRIKNALREYEMLNSAVGVQLNLLGV